MAFITEKKRESLIKKVNKSYGFRKFLMIIEMALLIGFIVVAFLSFTGKAPAWYETNKLTNFGIGMLVWAVIMTVLGLITLILILTLKSPKQVTAQVSHLESSARGGRKQSKSSAAAYKERTRVKEE